MSEQPADPTRSTRDHGRLRQHLEVWLGTVLDDATDVSVGDLATPDGSGMSSETLLFEARWSDRAGPHEASLVARIEPDPADVPIFAHYDLELQSRVIRLVAEASEVPAPNLRWLELDRSHLGAPFIVMDRVSGRVPADIPPYTFEGWLHDASAEQRRQLQDSSVEVLAGLHSIDAAGHDTAFLDTPEPGDTALRRHFAAQRRFYEWAREDRRHPVLEATFDWLEANWPDDSGNDVICWGDSRIGNIVYDGFQPAAVLDWEMATLGPRGLDVGWMTFMHTFFDQIALMLELPGLPDFMRPEDVVAHYASRTGHHLGDLDWYETYAALRHGIIMVRVTARQVHFGENEWRDDVDDAIPHRHVLEQMLEGSWWGR